MAQRKHWHIASDAFGDGDISRRELESYAREINVPIYFSANECRRSDLDRGDGDSLVAVRNIPGVEPMTAEFWEQHDANRTLAGRV